MESLHFVRIANINFIIDEASDLEACELLATNAKNLTLVISETLRHTHTACIRIDEAKRKNLGLSKIETVSDTRHQVSSYILLQVLDITIWGGGGTASKILLYAL